MQLQIKRINRYGVGLREELKKNTPKMVYSRDLLKMARQLCGIMD